jgi:hypothetical protein
MAHAPNAPNVSLAPEDYLATAEQEFRREIETYLQGAIQVAVAMANGTDPSMSHTIKRHQYIASVGVVTHG